MPSLDGPSADNPLHLPLSWVVWPATHRVYTHRLMHPLTIVSIRHRRIFCTFTLLF